MLRSGSGTGHRGHRAGVLSSVGGGWRAMARTPDNHDCASVSCASVSSDSRPCGRRCLAVWPLESGRVASGLSPRGVASFVHARLGVRGNQGRMVSNLPSLCPSTCHRCPDGALWWLASARTIRPSMGFPLIEAFPAYEPRRQGGRECAVRYRGCTLLFGLGGHGSGSSTRFPLALHQHAWRQERRRRR